MLRHWWRKAPGAALPHGAGADDQWRAHDLEDVVRGEQEEQAAHEARHGGPLAGAHRVAVLKRRNAIIGRADSHPETSGAAVVTMLAMRSGPSESNYPRESTTGLIRAGGLARRMVGDGEGQGLVSLAGGGRATHAWVGQACAAVADFNDRPDTFVNVNDPEECARVAARLVSTLPLA